LTTQDTTTSKLEDVQFNLKDPVHLAALGFGSGLIKPAPGTWGTLAAVPFFYALAQLPFIGYCIAVGLAALLGIYLCDKTAKDVGVHDHSSIVWDEFVGFWITMAIAPFHLYWVIAGFIYFRIFDILKPFPIGWLDKKVHGGLGIMLDDILAGFYAMGALYLTVQAYGYYVLSV